MKALPRVLFASLLACLLIFPALAVSDQLPTPLDKTVLPGTTTIHYAGLNLRFTTDVPLRVKLMPLSTTEVGITVRTHGSVPVNPVSGNDSVEIFWEDFNESIYDGPPMIGEWGGIINSESGFTEK